MQESGWGKTETKNEDHVEAEGDRGEFRREREKVGGRERDVLIVDGGGADSCNDLICLRAWRWKDPTPPERITPSFSVNRVNYLYNEICKVVNFSSLLAFLLSSCPLSFSQIGRASCRERVSSPV